LNRSPRNTLFAVCTAVVVVLSGCAAVDPARIPAIDTAGSTARLPGKIVWHDLLSQDPAAAKRFYGGLFSWTFHDTDLGGGQTYTVIEHDGRGIGGLVDGRGINRDTNVSRWIPVLSVPDLDTAMAAVRAGGGNVFQPPVDIPQRGRVAVVGDPQGAVVTLLESRRGDPADRPIADGDWLWHEIWSSDPEATIAFYRRLVPDYTETSVGEKEAYTYLEAHGEPRVGVLPKPVTGIKDTWMAYVRVVDPAATAATAARLGGRVLLAPRENPLGGEVAILNDPSGAGFLVQTWDPSWAQRPKTSR